MGNKPGRMEEKEKNQGCNRLEKTKPMAHIGVSTPERTPEDTLHCLQCPANFSTN